MNNFDDLKLATEAMTGGKNTVLLDDVGMPSVMVVIPKMNSKDLVTGATDETHPGFIVDGVEKDKVYISKFLNVVQNNRAYSLPMQDPYINVNFDNALNYCRNKGNGWGLMPASLWAAIALWCKKNGTMPHGNNNYGADIGYPHENGVATSAGSNGKTNRTAAGSGPVSWYHNHTDAGICDLNGNVWEWNAGMRLANGTIQVIPYANCMMPNCDMGTNSNEWKKIGLDGSYTDNSDFVYLDYNGASNVFYWAEEISNSSDTSRNASFKDLEANVALSSSAQILLRKLALLPEESDTDYGSDGFWANNGASEVIPYRGGSWTYGNGAGVFSINLCYARNYAATMVGFRSVYYDL